MIDLRKINKIKLLCIYCNENNINAKVTKDINALMKKLHEKMREHEQEKKSRK